VLHEATGGNRSAPSIDLAVYLKGLCCGLRRALDLDGTRNRLHVDVEPLWVSAATAQQLGLVVTELVTNAARHGIQADRSGQIWVTGILRGDRCYQLCVEDDGTGLPVGFDIRHRPSGLGLRVVNLLADQVRARLTADGRLGARFTLTLPALPGG
jgi:two-component sensor histidine kinase